MAGSTSSADARSKHTATSSLSSGEVAIAERALIIVPTYNERENIARLIETALAQARRLEILVVDDGSPDGTATIVEGIMGVNPRVHILRRAKKMGLGTAYLAGFRWALEHGFDIMFEMDADFSHDPGHLPDFLRAIQDHDLVLGSRYRDGKVTIVNWPIARLMLSYFANVYARFVTRVPLWDATGGFKCFRREVLEAIDLNKVVSNGYAFQIEMSFRAWKKGFRIVEIPIVFVDRTEGQSKMSKDIKREAFFMVWRLRWWALTNQL
ncbi:MAG TPA: polyprenol monophosphomannose synthase [Gemmatimonadaceae bacterium]|nr:polyprenol monophosphomannose synthase [Gemmatimonadaceae bacterium]